ncbi:MAG: glycosyltransferase [Gemmatimonadetes bacterium]|nr:glycosyltransferase [Gemmatimonadota bacterium]
MQKFDTALREYVLQKIAEIGQADIVVGLPTHNNEETVVGVMTNVYRGLEMYYPQHRAVVYVSDGGSLDYTRELAQKMKSAAVPKIVAIYRGVGGKGTSLRAVFQAAERLGAKAVAVVDADLRSITPEWMPALLGPVLSEGYDFVSPYYLRDKYDATITNHVAYSFTRALYGKRVRQPIGGDFGFSRRMVEYITHQEVWESDVARFGIDIWLTTLAICEGFKVCEARLGVKVHDPKDPALALGPMFRHVVGSMFALMARYEAVWQRVRGSQAVPLLGSLDTLKPEPVSVSLERLWANFQSGFEHFRSLWSEVLTPESYAAVQALAQRDLAAARLEYRDWARIVYDFAYTYSRWSRDRYKLVETMTPLYYGRVAAFVAETADMTTAEVEERVVERQAEVFEEEKIYLLERFAQWDAITPS